jgi:hypothetical protein
VLERLLRGWEREKENGERGERRREGTYIHE